MDEIDDVNKPMYRIRALKRDMDRLDAEARKIFETWVKPKLIGATVRRHISNDRYKITGAVRYSHEGHVSLQGVRRKADGTWGVRALRIGTLREVEFAE